MSMVGLVGIVGREEKTEDKSGVHSSSVEDAVQDADEEADDQDDTVGEETNPGEQKNAADVQVGTITVPILLVPV